jgi:hypothetical protein
MLETVIVMSIARADIGLKRENLAATKKQRGAVRK